MYQNTFTKNVGLSGLRVHYSHRFSLSPLMLLFSHKGISWGSEMLHGLLIHKNIMISTPITNSPLHYAIFCRTMGVFPRLSLGFEIWG